MSLIIVKCVPSVLKSEATSTPAGLMTQVLSSLSVINSNIHLRIHYFQKEFICLFFFEVANVQCQQLNVLLLVPLLCFRYNRTNFGRRS